MKHTIKARRSPVAYITGAIFGSAMVVSVCTGETCISSDIKRIPVVICTSVLIYLFSKTEDRCMPVLKPLAALGRCSLSLYLAHQIVIAFMYYAIAETLNIGGFALFVIVVGIFTLAFYYLAEKEIDQAAVSRSGRVHILAGCAVVCIVSTGTAGFVYLHAGVVRDVPELGISASEVHRGMHAEYCDIPYGWDRDFESDDKKSCPFS